MIECKWMDHTRFLSITEQVLRSYTNQYDNPFKKCQFYVTVNTKKHTIPYK